jgi:hypothetical protein
VLAVNLRGSFMCAREAIRHFLAEDKSGSIVNISSVLRGVVRGEERRDARHLVGVAGALHRDVHHRPDDLRRRRPDPLPELPHPMVVGMS